jgi:uncharacterized Zn finger protein
MKLVKCIITFNSEEAVEFLLDTNTSSFEDVEKVINDFKETPEYLENAWDSEDVLNILVKAGINLIPLNLDTEYEFELLEPQ